MSTAVMIMLLGLFAIPWTVAGVIHPAAAFMNGASRWKVLLCGIVALVGLLAIAKLLSGPQGVNGAKDSDAEAALSGLWLLACIGWPFIALVARTNSRAASHQQTASVLPKPPPEAKRPELLSKSQRKALDLPVVIKPQAPLKQPVAQTRAIRTGWQLCQVDFIYEDAKGDTSSRMVTVHWVGDTTFKGECHDRKAERTFRLDRVIGDITDIDTGEVLDPEDWADRYRS